MRGRAALWDDVRSTDLWQISVLFLGRPYSSVAMIICVVYKCPVASAKSNLVFRYPTLTLARTWGVDAPQVGFVPCTPRF